MTEQSKEQPDIEKIARKVQKFITNPPVEALERMKRRREELGYLRNPVNIDKLMARRY